MAGARGAPAAVASVPWTPTCESFFATLECELLDRRSFRSHAEARMVAGRLRGRSPRGGSALSAAAAGVYSPDTTPPQKTP